MLGLCLNQYGGLGCSLIGRWILDLRRDPAVGIKPTYCHAVNKDLSFQDYSWGRQEYSFKI